MQYINYKNDSFIMFCTIVFTFSGSNGKTSTYYPEEPLIMISKR